MNPRALAALLVAALALAAGGWWWNRSPAAPPPASPADAAAQAKPSAAPSGTAAALEAPGSAAEGNPEAASARTEPAPAPPEVFEPVVPLIELVALSAGGNATDSAESGAASIDELLGARHAGKTQTQLLASWRAVQNAIERQRDPAALPKDEVLPEAAVQALSIEAAWLKERAYP